MLRSFLLVGIGGAIGSMLRYGTGMLIPRPSGVAFPAATFMINLTGSFMIGLLAGIPVRNAWMAATGWPLLAVGVCGGFTTFSAFSLEALKLFQAGAATTALIYLVASVASGIALCYAGYLITAA